MLIHNLGKVPSLRGDVLLNGLSGYYVFEAGFDFDPAASLGESLSNRERTTIKAGMITQ